MNERKKTPGELADIRETVDVDRPAVSTRPGVSDPSNVHRFEGRQRRRTLTAAEYVDGVLSGDRTLLARAITLVESNAPAHFELAQEVVQALLPHRGRSVRVGITGVPGAGKSTLIETLGTLLTGRGLKVAVTAVDPSSTVTGGSVLGDKTRMEKLANDPGAFVRPSPSGGTLGGVTRKTRETILLMEAAGYDVVLVETMGVGQSETVVREMVDFFLLVLIAGAGDELQGIKKGVIELADAIAVNKADGANTQAAELARSEYEHALHYLRPATEGWQTRAYTCSAMTGAGVSELWDVVTAFAEATRASGAFARRRSQQERRWVRQIVREQLEERFLNHERVKELLPVMEDAVGRGEVPAVAAARRLLDAFASDEDA
jgi:LAO/AO transport system kinase